MRSRLIPFFCVLLTAIAACTLPPRDTGKSYMFMLEQGAVAKQVATNATLTVALPTSSSELDTYRIALKRKGQVWDYYAGARWNEFLPVVVQHALIGACERSRKFKAVTSDETGFTNGWILKTEIRDFQAEYDADHAAPLIKIRLAVSVYSQENRKIVSSFNIDAEQRAEKDSLPVIQAAFQAAFNKIQTRLTARLGTLR